MGRERAGAGAEQPRRDPQPDRLSRAPLRQAPRPHHHRPAQLLRRRPERCRRASARSTTRRSRDVLRAGDDRARRGPRRQWREAAGRASLPRCDAFPIRARRGSRAPSSAPSRRRGSRTSCAVDRDLEDLGQFAGRARLPRWTRKTFPPEWSRSRGRRTPIGDVAQQRLRRGLCRARRRSTTSSATRRSPASRIVSGDRHSFWAGYAAAKLPPRKFEPVGVELRRRVAGQPGGDGRRLSTGSRRTGRCARFISPTGRTAKAGVDLQHAAEARRPLGPRICQDVRPRRRTACRTRSLRRTSSSSTWAATAMRRCG